MTPLRVLAVLFACLAASAAGGEATHVYFGDTHLHTSLSPDASLMGNGSADPDTAYRYAKGLPVVHPSHRARVQIDVPLDFLAVADHAEFLGIIPALFAGDPRVGDGPETRRFLGLVKERKLWPAFQILNAQAGTAKIDPGMASRDVNAEAWKKIIDAAEAHNDPGSFTALIGWEWSSMPMKEAAIQGPNLHRVVLLREGGKVARKFMPYSAFDSQRPEDLWAWLAETGKKAGATLLAIPHNSNIGMGRMFDLVDSDAVPMDAEYARARMRWEPVAEITQIKGDSETHPFLSPDDEFADYELFLTAGTEPSPGDFVRSAMRRGLEIESETGVNPYQFGLIGSSDAHTGLASVEEANFHSKWSVQSTPETMLAAGGASRGAAMGAAGLAAVWARENTREAIFDAFQRKEVYATTGTRLRVRFFGGQGFERDDMMAPDPSVPGYAKGVPMGGELRARDGRPQFFVHAEKDPVGANLDRIQIVKGWVDAKGHSHERVFNVSFAGAGQAREMDRAGNIPPVGNTVDLASGRYSNSIGIGRLAGLWSDPDFDPAVSAFYYARVLEIPTARHSLLDAIALGRPHPEELPATVQERAYTSPIWVKP
jgi:hypothetical protein